MKPLKTNVTREGQSYVDEPVRCVPKQPGMLEYAVWQALGTAEEYIHMHRWPDGTVTRTVRSRRIPPEFVSRYERVRLNWLNQEQ